MAATGEIDTRWSQHDTETIERGLWMLALHGGNATKAAEATGIPRTTLLHWRNRHAERYEKIQHEASSRLADKIAADAEAFMVNAARVEALALEQLEAQIAAGQVKDVGSALRNITTSKALNNDKIASPLRGRATTVTEHRTPDESIKRLMALVPGFIVNGTAQEIPEAPTLPEGTPAPSSVLDDKRAI